MLHIFTIVLDGQPFIGWQIPVLNQLTCKWHWTIAEGAAANINCTSWCKSQPSRLSRDGTTEILHILRDHPRVTILQKQRWEGKLEMVNACLATFKMPGVLLQLDVDEFWTAAQLDRVVHILGYEHEGARGLSANFFCRYFLGPNIVIKHDSDAKNNSWMRAWNFTPGQRFLKHEPPVLQGARPPTISREAWARSGVIFDHLAYVLPSQVEYKEKFYGYKQALAQWRQLQRNQSWPVNARTFLPWCHPDSTADLLHKPNL
jgi:hypothetical protein